MMHKILLTIVMAFFLQGCASKNKYNDSAYFNEYDYLPTYIGLDKLHKDIGQSISSLLSKNKNDENYTSLEGVSFLVDAARYHNGFSQIKKINFPQQKNSKRKIYILESLEHGFRETGKIDENGYAVFDAEAYNSNLLMSQSKDYKKNLQSATSGITIKHDFDILRVASRGVKNNYIGLLDYNNSKKSHFSLDPKSQTFDANQLIEKITWGANNGYNIISMSFFPNIKNWGKLLDYNSKKASKEYYNILNRKKQELSANQSDLIKNLNYLWLISLDNSLDTENNPELSSKAASFQKDQKNIMFVSSTPFSISDDNRKEYKISRKNLINSGVEVFTVLTPSYDVIPLFNDNLTFELKKPKQEAMSTSFATPYLATIIHNIWSILPSLTPEQIKNILKSTSNTSDEEAMEYGYVINPSGAYKFTLGLLIINGYKNEVYPSLSEYSIDSTEDNSWIISNSKNNNLFKINDHNDIFDQSTIYTSKLSKNNKTEIVKIALGQIRDKLTPSHLSIKINAAEFYHDHIKITLDKTYMNRSYKDVTRKVLILKFINGNPEVIVEYPVSTTSYSRES